MYGYKNITALLIIEYFVALALHVIFAFNHSGTETGKYTLFVSVFLFIIMAGFSIICKNKRAVVCFFVCSVIVAVSLLGYTLETLSASCLIFTVTTVTAAVFLDSFCVLFSTVLSVVMLAFYAIAFPSITFKYVSPLMWVFYVSIFLFAAVNLCIVVSHSVKYMKGMEEKAKEAERANEAKMRFLSNMSHEIRTPMNAICGMAELTLQEQTLSDTVRENTESIQNAGRVLISIVNDILDYSKLEAGKLDIIPVTYSIRMMFDDLMNMMKLRLEDKEVEIRCDIQEDIPDILYGDEIRVRQIMFNILSNAVKFTEKGYVVIDVKGEKTEEDIALKISVTDSGIGIRKENLNSIFNGFSIFDTHRSNAKEGTGLGLALTKQLLFLMDGDIQVESSYGVGSRFIVSLTQKISEQDKDLHYAKHESSEVVEKIFAPTAKVLVVDDNGVNLKVAKGLLKSFGIEADTCLSGIEAIGILRNDPTYDMVFLDHMMPELDGIETLKALKKEDNEQIRNIPFIALTANVASGIRDMFISEGFTDYVSKPIDMVWLNGILRKYISLDKQK